MKANREILQELYWQRGYSTTDIGVELNISRTHVAYLLKRYNIPTRSHPEAYRMAEQQGKRMHYSGENHPNWRGGRTQRSKSGYILAYAPNHPRASVAHKYAFEHILIWEQVHNRPLPEGYIIHHINGIPTDNRPENLIAMPRSKHGRVEFFEALKKRVRELEAKNRLLEKALNDNQLIFGIGEN